MATLTALSSNLSIENNYRVKISDMPTVPAFMEVLAKEVKNQPRHVQRRFYKILRNSYLVILPLLITPHAHAQKIGFPQLDKAHGLEILPPEIMDILIEIIIAAGVLGVAFAILCLMIAGGYRMIGQSMKAQNWSTDIIKGLGQVLLAPVIILILVTITSLVFRNVPGLDLFF
jgi:uncharacterized membrane protein YdfJ with MMPL/SSD domain